MESNKKQQQTILVFINAHPKSHVLIRAASNSAKDNGVNWTAVYIETPVDASLDNDEQARLLRFSTLVERLGGQFHQVESKSVIEGIVSYTEALIESGNRIKNVIIGQSSEEGFFSELTASLAERAARELRHTETAVQIIPLSGQYYAPSWYERLKFHDLKWKEIASAVLFVALAFMITEILRYFASTTEWWINDHNVMGFFLTATVITALRFGLVPGLISALLGFTTINYFYIAPLSNFGLDHSADGVSLSIFLITAVIVAMMGAYSRASNKILMRKERRSQALYSILRIASNANTQKEALKILHEQLSNLLEYSVAFYTPTFMQPEKVTLAYPVDVELSTEDRKALDYCWANSRASGIGALNSFDTNWRFEPMMTSNGEVGVLGVKVKDNYVIDASFGRLLTALADQAANILERIELTKMMGESRVREEREKLRSTLLSSVSHDLKTPLASIIGALSVYKRMRKAGRLSEDIADELTETALDEAQRLDSFISNILDMTRIESGEIEFNKGWVSSEEPVAAVRKRLRQRLRSHTLVITPPEKMYDVEMDQMMTEQVLQNVVDNAAKYSPSNTEIHISYGPDANGFSYKIRDHGKGIPDEKFEAIFDKYERLKLSDSKIAGTGLGLAICRASMEKQHGKIEVTNHEDGGAIFSIWFPNYRPAEKEQTETREKVTH